MIENINIEQANEQLEKIVGILEEGNLSLEESIDYYEKAFNLLEFCYTKLNNCNMRITTLNKRLGELKAMGEIIDETIEND